MRNFAKAKIPAEKSPIKYNNKTPKNILIYCLVFCVSSKLCLFAISFVCAKIVHFDETTKENKVLF